MQGTEVIVVLGSGTWDQNFGKGNISAFALASACAFVCGCLGLFMLPKLSRSTFKTPYREMILAERSTKIDDYMLKKKARETSSKVEMKTRKESPPPLRGRPSLRSDKPALNELRAKR
ncbi:uncharacterized protein A4U43_C03F21180 [Asparagus officinalis]|uniref:Uncharacterized protein n=1 Tax=Asparagus officinalis TaxID=4686 RepID=A0A5P1FEM5_ASPOF|nr:uncharacterized protein A4U43_C03F21180 [Asparagus officinalis]